MKKAPERPRPFRFAVGEGSGESLERLRYSGRAMRRHREVINRAALRNADLFRSLQFREEGFAFDPGGVGVLAEHLILSGVGRFDDPFLGKNCRRGNINPHYSNNKIAPFRLAGPRDQEQRRSVPPEGQILA